jgi:hypothetical protein
MELISSPKTEYLLEASLATLHTESREWMSEINFWSEEMSCFYKLLRKNVSSFTFPPKELAEIEREMIRINSGDLMRVKSLVERHEKELAAVMKNTSMIEEGEYRDRHRALVSDLYALQLDIRKFKKAVFALIKNS